MILEMTLDDFVLKMKQGESVEVNLNHKLALACAMKINTDIILINFIDKKSLKTIYNKETELMGDIFIIGNQSKILCLSHNPEIKTMLYQLGSSDIHNHYSIESIWEINNTIKNIICSYQGDNAALKEDKKYFRFRDVHNIEYFDAMGWILGNIESLNVSPVVVLGLGINNFAYAQGKFLLRNDFNIQNILGYLKYGLEYLRYIPESKNYDIELYRHLFEKYRNVKAYINEFIEDELIARLCEDGKQSLYINGEIIKDFQIQGIEHKIYDSKNKRNILFKDINILTYKGKEIFNRAKELKRLESDAFQFGIEGIIAWIRQKDHYKKFDLVLDNETLGDLVYTKQGHFGVVIGKNIVCLDNGKKMKLEEDKEDINLGIYKAIWKDELNKWKDEADVLIKGYELNRGLCEIKAFIINNYCNELFKEIEDEVKRG